MTYINLPIGGGGRGSAETGTTDTYCHESSGCEWKGYLLGTAAEETFPQEVRKIIDLTSAGLFAPHFFPLMKFWENGFGQEMTLWKTPVQQQRQFKEGKRTTQEGAMTLVFVKL